MSGNDPGPGDVDMNMQQSSFDRYELLDVVNEFDDVTFWRGRDTVLDRQVAIRGVRRDHPRVTEIHAAATSAAALDDRRLARILDVLETDDYLLVVSEWIDGRSLLDIVDGAEPLTPLASLDVLRHVAGALQSGVREGLAHHRLRPSNVILTDSGEVRLTGLAVDAALWGPFPGENDPDIHGLGALLYVATTGRWVAPPGDASYAGGQLPPAPRIHDKVMPASQVVADIPRLIDELTGRCLPEQRDAGQPFNSVDEAATVFTTAADRFDPSHATLALFTPKPGFWQQSSGTVIRVAAIAVVVVLAATTAFVGWAIATGGEPPLRETGQQLDTTVLTAPASTAPTLPGATIDMRLTPVSVTPFDPFGPDEDENSELAAYATDADNTTAWRTDDYGSADLSGKQGVGLVLDLGSPNNVRAVRLVMEDPGANVEVRVADEVYPDPVLWTELGRQESAGAKTTFRVPRPIPGRYVLIWFSELPFADWSYRAGITSVTVFS